MSIIVARCGFNRNTKKEVLYGPLELGGANFRHLYVEQGVGQINLFVRHWRSNSTAGKLLKVAVAWFQQQAGVSFSILEDVHTPLPHLESKWIASLRTFLATTDMFLQVDTPSIPQPQRLRDFHLMDAIISSKKFTSSEIRRLNYCRLFLRAVTLSDIALLDGKNLDMSLLRGAPSLNSSTTHGNSIHQERPAELEWKLWRKANLLWSDASGKFHESLGPWTVPVAEQRQTHHAYWQYDKLCGADTVLFVRVNGMYISCTQAANAYEYSETTQSRAWEALPADVCAVQAWPMSSGIWQVESSTATMRGPRRSVGATFQDYIDTLPAWEAELLQHIELPSDPFSACVTLSHGLRAVSDGSVWDNNQGAYGWTISNDRGERMAHGMGPARGAHVDSYRAEAYGMLAILSFLKRLADFTMHIEPWFGILATDSQSLLDTIAEKTQSGSDTVDPVYGKVKHMHQLDVTCPEWDIVSGILEALAQWPQIKLQYVRGHQDRTKRYTRLPLLAQLNVDADAMATRYQRDHGAVRQFVLLTQTAGVHLVSPNGTHTSTYEAVIRHQATHSGLLKYIQERNGWSDWVVKSVNWEAHGASLRQRIKHRTHFVKLVHGIIPTCRQLHRHDPIRRLCPLCKGTQEDWIHVLQCTHQKRTQLRSTMIANVSEKCKSLRTRPLLLRVLRDAMIKWGNQQHPDITLNPNEYPSDVHRLIRQQNEIGWKQIWLGRFSAEWSDLQDSFYTRKQTREKTLKMTGQRWQVALIGMIWDQWRVIWESRNQDLHGADTIHRQEAEAREVRRDLRDLYDQRSRVDPHVQALFHENIGTHYAKPNWVNRNWIAIHAPIVKENLKSVAIRAKAGVRSIREYLIPKPLQ